MELNGPRWTQFRRLLLGTVIEVVQEAGVPVSLTQLSLRFHEGSRFDVPRFDNHMRFTGEARMGLTASPSAEALERLRAGLQQVWPEILAVVDLPIGDRLTNTQNDTSAAVEDGILVVQFDLVAD